MVRLERLDHGTCCPAFSSAKGTTLSVKSFRASAGISPKVALLFLPEKSDLSVTRATEIVSEILVVLSQMNENDEVKANKHIP